MPLFIQERCSNTADSRLHAPSIIEGNMHWKDGAPGQIVIKITGPVGLTQSKYGDPMDVELTRVDYGFIEVYDEAGPARLLSSYEEVDELLARFRKPREEWTKPTH